MTNSSLTRTLAFVSLLSIILLVQYKILLPILRAEMVQMKSNESEENKLNNTRKRERVSEGKELTNTSQSEMDLLTDQKMILEPKERISMFDNISMEMYKLASGARVPQHNRHKFTLNGWERGTGGLDDADRELLGEIYRNATSVFEFGLGESTFIAAHVNVPRYAGVDADADWVVKTREIVKHRPHFRFHFADIGKTGAFSFAVRNYNKNLYNYQIQSLMTEQQPFDFYLVDGRYRVACAVMSFLHAMKYGADMRKVRVGVHDNDKVRREYGVMRRVADARIKRLKLWVYELKGNVTGEDLYRLYHEVKAKTW